MNKDKDPLMLLDLAAQKTFEFVESDGFNLELVGVTPEGFGMYKRLEAHGGYSYWSDESPIGIMVYDEGISNPLTLFAALNDLKVGELMWRHIGEVYGYTSLPTME